MVTKPAAWRRELFDGDLERKVRLVYILYISPSTITRNLNCVEGNSGLATFTVVITRERDKTTLQLWNNRLRQIYEAIYVRHRLSPRFRPALFESHRTLCIPLPLQDLKPTTWPLSTLLTPHRRTYSFLCNTTQEFNQSERQGHQSSLNCNIMNMQAKKP